MAGGGCGGGVSGERRGDEKFFLGGLSRLLAW